MRCWLMRVKRVLFGCGHSSQSMWVDNRGWLHCNDCDGDCEERHG